jgi:dCMP deaminase
MNKNIDDSYWMKIVNAISQASTCRVKIGTVLVKNKVIVGVGYLGSVSGDAHCCDIGCLLVDNLGMKGSGDSGFSCERCIHSEMNAILKCQERGVADSWIECYTCYSPCLNCLKCLLAIGVKKIVFAKRYKDLNRDLYMRDLLRPIRDSLAFYQYEND